MLPLECKLSLGDLLTGEWGNLFCMQRYVPIGFVLGVSVTACLLKPAYPPLPCLPASPPACCSGDVGMWSWQHHNGTASDGQALLIQHHAAATACAAAGAKPVLTLEHS